MTIEELKAILPGAKVCGKPVVDAGRAYNALAPEILALVEAVEWQEYDRGDLSKRVVDALNAFYAKLEAL